MLRVDKKGIYTSSLFPAYPGLVHGYTQRVHGDMRDTVTRNAFFSGIELPNSDVVWPDQVHGTHVARIVNYPRENRIECDALVALLQGVEFGSRTLAIHVADCVPLLFFDAHSGVIAAAHAGWRGTFGGISGNVIDEMCFFGSRPENIFVSLGPHIGACCYSVPEERAERFRKKSNESVRTAVTGEIYLDLARANVHDLLMRGVRREHIDAHPTCTACQVDTFYSYRKDEKKMFGEIVGFIGLQRTS
ncbi:MAG: peptidoglycan editing factor PgeF [bacterium]|nr:peptidoglycan editing factor PgeF [bacterium]